MRFTLAAIIALSVAGCDLLKTRDPQPPSQTRSAWIPPTSAAILTFDLVAMVNERNAAKFGACIADTGHTRSPYVFAPSPDAASQYPLAFASWNHESENVAFRNLVREVGSDSLLLSASLSETVAASDSAVYDGTYTLVARHKRSSIPTTVAGRMQLIARPDVQNPSTWVIVKWTDLSTGGPAWSTLKGAFAD